MCDGSRRLTEFPAKIIGHSKRDMALGDERLGQSFQRAGLGEIRRPGVKFFLRGEPGVQHGIGFIGADILQRGKNSEREEKLSEHFHFVFSSGQTGTK